MTQFHAFGDGVERRRLGLFLLVAFGIAWATASVLYATGGFRDSPTVFESGPLSLSLASLLLPTAYMFAPGIANVVTRVLTREGWDDLLVSPNFFEQWDRYVTAWVAPGVLTALGAALFFVGFPQYFDPTARAFAESVGAGGQTGMSPLVLAAVTVGAAFVINPLFNTIFALGEEFGWRGYLLPKLGPLGLRKAVLLHGVVWGVWHWPLIAMGYEYGFGYVGFPWTGFALFVAFTLAAGTFLAWLTVETNSVWPASLAHGALNGTVVVALVFSQGNPTRLVGPLPIGVVGMVPWILLAGYLLSRMGDGTPLPWGSDETPAVRSADE